MAKENGEIDLDYVNSIQKPPKWIIERANERFKNCHSQAEIQELIIGVSMTPDGVKDQENPSIAKTKWRPTYVPENVLDCAIHNQQFGQDQIAVMKIGYQQMFDSIGKLYHPKIRRGSADG